jgi:glycerol-3-phosphate dehydrogenase (NAD(P)+)
MKPLGVLGAGSFGTALAIHAARAGRAVRLWARRAEAAAEIARGRENRTYLPGVALPAAIEVTHDLAPLAGCDPLLLAPPSHGFREVLRDFLAVAPSGRGGDGALRLVSATKGIEAGTLARMSRVTAEECARAGIEHRFLVLSGPTFAAELARGVPSAAVVAAEDDALAAALRQELASPTFRLYSASDVVGVELAGTAKNVIAIAAGAVAGLELGHSTLAALVTRGLHEIARLGVAYGGDPKTFSGLAGLGDLVLTCTGALSRNRRTGLELARGKSLAEIEAATTEIAEGVRNSLVVQRLARRAEIEMPIVDQMVAVLYEGKSPRRAVHDLMTRELKEEARL